MAYPGGLDLQALAKLNDIDPAEEGVAAIGSRSINADGDGRPDLYLVDLDGDGSVDSLIRAVDTNDDGVNDTFIQFGEDGKVDSIGRVDPATGELDVVYEEPGAFDEILGSLGLTDLESPEEALFTSFEDPYIMNAYGTLGEDVRDRPGAGGLGRAGGSLGPARQRCRRGRNGQDEPGAAGPGAEAASTDAGAEAADIEGAEPPEVIPKIVEIEDRSGGDGSSLWAKVDEDAEGWPIPNPDREDEHRHLLRRHQQGRLFRGRQPRSGRADRYRGYDGPGVLDGYGRRGAGRRARLEPYRRRSGRGRRRGGRRGPGRRRRRGRGHRLGVRYRRRVLDERRFGGRRDELR